MYNIDWDASWIWEEHWRQHWQRVKEEQAWRRQVYEARMLVRYRADKKQTKQQGKMQHRRRNSGRKNRG